jgi:hypothetical protein
MGYVRGRDPLPLFPYCIATVDWTVMANGRSTIKVARSFTRRALAASVA